MNEVKVLRSIIAFLNGISRLLLKIWVRTEVVGAKDLTQNTSDNHEDRADDSAKPDKVTFYALPQRSYSAALVVDSETRKHDLPHALESFEIEGKRFNNRVIYLSRSEGNWFRRRNMPYLHPNVPLMFELNKANPNLDIEIIPVNVFWGRSPNKEKSFLKIWLGDTWSVTGPFRRFVSILLNGRNTFVNMSQPINVTQMQAENSKLDEARFLRKLGRILRVHFRHIRTAVIGPDLSHRRTLVHRLVRKPMVKAAIEKEMQDKGISREKAKARAIKYGDEIASNQSHSTIRFLDILLTWVWNKLYNGVNVHNLDGLKKVYKDNEIIYVPCHRSHIDYLLLSYVLFKNGIVPPQIAAGINLNLPVVGPILRRGGAFFMRRSFKDNPLYSAVFDEYLHAIFTSGYSTEYFVEGGRSRTGRTLKPRAGMIAMTVRSFLRDSHKPIVFMPVYIGYEKVFEGGTYIGELRGKSKKKESLSGVFKTIKDLKKNFGKVNLAFGDPIDLNSYLEQENPGWKQQDHGADYRPDWVPKAVSNLSLEVVTQINKAAVLNPINMVSLALLATPKQSMDEKILSQTLNLYRDLAQDMPYSHLTQLPEGDGQDWIHYAEEMNAIERLKHPLGDIIRVDEEQAVMLTYYRNNVIHLYAIPSMLACLFINNMKMKRQDAIRFATTIYPYLKAELFLHWQEDEIQPVVEQWLDLCVEKGYLSADGEFLVRPSVSSNDYIILSVLSEQVIQILERYYIAIALLQRSGSGTLTKDEMVQNCSLMAQRISILHGLNAPEFFDKALFKNLIDELLERQVLSLDDEKIIFGDSINIIAEDARILLNAELRRSILQVTLN
ncbi:Glycerol-3-phosphate O-acyltransferase [Oceanobacter sp. RED65]|uniref:Glycerol-3-phosphate acyltransferase n=1 Tax=Bermanella marisrubri TaxID=207949 RepID=Q1N1Z5_9GAMM|nr:Glycerol-3-phosphate O-acyltransferase [Oceanobacter sp. RED65] [Bermanella marisrubri]